MIERYGLPCYTEGLGAKGCVVFASEPLREYRDYLTKVDDDLSTLAWLYHMNHGIFMTPGVEEEWTLSIAHTEEHVQRYLDAFEAFATDLMGNQSRGRCPTASRTRPAPTSSSTRTTRSTGTRGARRRSPARRPRTSRCSSRSATPRATGAT